MSLAGVLVFLPSPHHDDRGFFTRTFDAAIAREHGLAPEDFVQDSQSRSRRGTVRGLHLRGGRGEAKLVRCARGAVFDVLVDARPESPTFGQHMSITLDDTDVRAPLRAARAAARLPGAHRADRHLLPDRPRARPGDDLSVRYDDPDLDIPWPLPVQAISDKDLAAGSWADLVEHLGLSRRGAAG